MFGRAVRTTRAGALCCLRRDAPRSGLAPPLREKAPFPRKARIAESTGSAGRTETVAGTPCVDRVRVDRVRDVKRTRLARHLRAVALHSEPRAHRPREPLFRERGDDSEQAARARPRAGRAARRGDQKGEHRNRRGERRRRQKTSPARFFEKREFLRRETSPLSLLAGRTPPSRGGTLSSFSQSSSRGASRRRRRAESRASQADQPGHSRGRRAERVPHALSRQSAR